VGTLAPKNCMFLLESEVKCSTMLIVAVLTRELVCNLSVEPVAANQFLPFLTHLVISPTLSRMLNLMSVGLGIVCSVNCRRLEVSLGKRSHLQHTKLALDSSVLFCSF
jgi:hypothetical protein